MRISLTLALTGILTLTYPISPHADTIPKGVRFDIMPLGCRIHVAFSNGDSLIRDFTEKRGDTYIVKTYSGKKLKMTSTMNAAGFVIRNDMADGTWETFAPYSCLLEPGYCTFISRNSKGLQRTFKGEVTQNGNEIITSGGFVGEKTYPTSHAKLSRFNTIDSMTNGDISYRITKYEGCGKP